MTERAVLVQQLVTLSMDYQLGKIGTFNANHVERWLNQFPEECQNSLLKELNFVLAQSYIQKKHLQDFIENKIIHPHTKPTINAQVFNHSTLLDIQGAGNSQRDCIAIFRELLQANAGIDISINNANATNQIYLDDVIYSGQRMRTDVSNWILAAAPPECNLYIMSHSMHRLSLWYSTGFIEKKIAESKKKINLKWVYGNIIEDRLAFTDTSDVLRPVAGDNGQSVNNYIQTMSKPPVYRRPGNVGGRAFFSSDAGRQLLENEFLKAGARIKEICPKFKVQHRPLGYMSLESLGFGTMIVTYRNCPNNAPLALWAGHPWYPLFPRSNN